MRAYTMTAWLLVTGACFAACSSDNGAGSLNSSSGGWGGSGWDSSFGSAGVGGTIGSGGSAGGAGWGGTTAEGGSSNAPDAGADATSDSAPDADACAALDTSKSAVFFLSADDSNSMASPVIARRLLSQGSQVPPHLVRTYEFLNYYNIGFPAAAPTTLAIMPELRSGGDGGGFELGIGIVAPAAQSPRRPINVTFVLDTSGSMTGAPIELERAAVSAIASELQQGDLVSMVTWNTANSVLLDSFAVAGPNDPTLLGIVKNQLVAGGGTDLHGGLTAGYQIATKNFDKGRLNRVVLISDGEANVGITDEQVIGQGAALNDGEGIYLVGVGVGEGVNDTLMNAVTDAGRGAYVYLDTAAEAQRILSQRFDEVMEVAARGVQVELRLPWYMGIAKFYGEEYSTNPQEIEPQHLAPDDAMFFDQLLSPCSDSVYSADDPVEIIARWQVPVSHQPLQVSKATTFGELLAQSPKYLPKAAAIIAYAEALKDVADTDAKLGEAKASIAAADPAGSDPELKEIAALIDKALIAY